MNSRRQILTDHTRRGKMLITPFNEKLGPIKEISWISEIIPEIVWIGLIHHTHRYRDSMELITSFTRTVRNLKEEIQTSVFSGVSEYTGLDQNIWQDLRTDALQDGSIFDIQRALEPLIALYPECPLRHLFTSLPVISDKHVDTMKRVVGNLFQRSERDPMMVQATAIWLAFDSGKLKVFEGLALSNFPEIEKYPDTEESRKIGASVRATLNLQYEGLMQSEESISWRNYFWKRGMQLSDCEVYDE